MPTDKRRSDRIMLTIPLRAQWTDTTGKAFEEEDARSVAINRHGARVHLKQAVHTGQILRLTNRISHMKADFRVVGPVTPLTSAGGEWGVECTNLKENIWGIQFPPIEEGPGGESRALLECRNCKTAALLPLSLVEVDVLETAGIITRECKSCEASSPWGYAEKQLAMGAPPGEAAMLAEAQAQLEESQKGAERRKHRRVCLQLPVSVRDYYGGVEITKSENVSKGGFSFSSDKNYFMGQGLLAVCPYSPSAQNIEVRGRIVRRHPIEGVQRKLYGVRYDAAAG